MMQRSTTTRLFKVLLSLALLGGILMHAGPRAVAAQIGAMDIALVGVASALLLGGPLVRALNWFQLIRSGGREVALSSVTYGYFVGGFFGALLPSTLSTDVARSAVVAARSNIPVEAYLATTVLLNVLSLAVISAVAIVACALVLGRPGTPDATIVISAAVACAWLLAVAAAWARAKSARAPRPPATPTETGLRGRLKRRFAQFVSALVILPRGSRLAGVGLVAALSYSLRSLGWLALLVAADAQITWVALLTIGPLITLGAALPISVLGFGGFQAISVYLLAQWGVPMEQALAASLVQSGLTVLLHSVGCIVYIAGDRAVPRALGAGEAGR